MLPTISIRIMPFEVYVKRNFNFRSLHCVLMYSGAIHTAHLSALYSDVHLRERDKDCGGNLKPQYQIECSKLQMMSTETETIHSLNFCFDACQALSQKNFFLRSNNHDDKNVDQFIS